MIVLLLGIGLCLLVLLSAAAVGVLGGWATRLDDDRPVMRGGFTDPSAWVVEDVEPDP